MFRRSFLKSLAAAPVAGLAWPRRLDAALPKAKITKVNIYEPPNVNRLFNQSNMLVTVETDIGITGVGEGGSKDTLEQCAGNLIGQNPFQIERLWQEMYVSWFYPPGREKIHAQGALDLALWDIKGKALNAPVHEILGGSLRNFCECYATGNVRPPAAGRPMPLARIRGIAPRPPSRPAIVPIAWTPAGTLPSSSNVYNTRERVRLVAEACKAAREGLGKGDFTIDFHQRFDYSDALRCCKLIEEYEPFLVEDPVRDEHALPGHPQAAADDHLPAGARRGVGPALGLQPAGREPRHRLHPRHAAQRRRDHRDDEGGGHVRDARGGHRPAFHGTGRDGRPGELPVHVLRPGAVGVQLRRPARSSTCPSSWTSRTARLYTNDRPGLGVTLDVKRLKHQLGDGHHAGRRNVLPAAGRLRDALVSEEA